MADEYDLEAVVRFHVEGQADVTKGVQDAQKGLDALRKSGKITEDTFQELATAITRYGTALKNANTNSAVKQIDAMGKAARDQTNIYNDYLASQKEGLATKKAQEKADAAAAAAAEKNRTANEKAFAAFLAEGAANDKAAASAQAKKRAREQDAEATKKQAQAARDNAAAIKAEDAARKAELAGLKTAIQARNQEAQLGPRQRYALYDLATTYAVVSAAALGLSVVSIKTAADFESAFTGVERTLDPAYQGVEDLRKSLVDLSTQIPLTFQDVSKIAQLGNQLGIAGESVVGFTETVAQFSAVSGISVEETAQAFGRLQSLLGITADDFDQLGSSIALVGVNSAATEQQIINIAKEIAPFTRAAGFGADGAIGLSGALASLAVAPERARSAIQQFSTQLRKSVAEGGDSLANFAALTGMTTEELDKLVRSGQDGDKIFRAFLGTLSTGDPVQITQALDALNLSNLRVDTTIQALTQNIPLLDRAMADATQGYDENAELARQYALVVDDLNSQFMLFVNSLNALVATLSGGAASGLADLLAIVTGIINEFRTWAEENQWITNLAGAIIVISTLIGVLTAFKVANLLAMASTIAFNDALIATKGTGFASGITSMIGALFGFTGATQGATLATKAFRVALISTGIGALLVGLGYAIALFTDTEATVRGTVDVLGGLFDIISGLTGGFADYLNGLAEWRQGIADTFPVLQGFVDILNQVAAALGNASYAASSKGRSQGLDILFPPSTEKRVVNVNAIFGDLTGTFADVAAGSGDVASGIGNVGKAAGGAAKQVRTLVDYASDLATVFSRSFDLQFKSGLAMDAVADSWQALTDRIADARRELLGLTADKAIKEYFLSVANQFGDSLRAGVLTGEIADLNAKIAEEQANASTELNGNTKAARQNRKVITDLAKGYQDYITALAEGGADQATLNAAVAASEAEFRAQATALGFSNAQLQPYIASFRSLTTVINAIPRNITVGYNPNPALQALNEFAAKATAAGAAGGAGFAAGMNAGFNRVGRGMDLQNEILKQQATLAQYLQSGNVAGARYLGQYIQTLIGKLKTGSYASGGYTGAGGKYEPAGIVHRGEYVIPKHQVDQRTGRPYADALGNLQRGTRSASYASGGHVSGPVFGAMDLTPQAARMIANAVAPQVAVYLGPEVVARASNAGNASMVSGGSKRG